jgi:hypothetical protein
MILEAIEHLQPKNLELREYVQQCLAYSRGYEGRMSYGELRTQGYFIGSGVIERTCEHIVEERFERTSMR